MMIAKISSLWPDHRWCEIELWFSYAACLFTESHSKRVTYFHLPFLFYYRCSKCGTESSSFRWRFMLSLLVSDSTGFLWITSFQDTSRSILGVDAETLGQWQVGFGVLVDLLAARDSLWSIVIFVRPSAVMTEDKRLTHIASHHVR